MCSRVLFVTLVSCCPWLAFGEWYHLNAESGFSVAPDVIMSMTDITVESSTTGKFHYTKDNIPEEGNITHEGASLLKSDAVITDVPGYNAPGMHFDGKTYVNLGDHTDSCFDNAALCPNGRTMGLWLKLPLNSALVFDSGPLSTHRGSALSSVGVKASSFVYSGVRGCLISKNLHLNEWIYLMLSLDSTECEIMEILLSGVRTKLTSKFIDGTKEFPPEQRFILGGISRSLSVRGIFDLDEFTVWYQKLDTMRDGSVFLSQTALASICTDVKNCESVPYSDCTRNAGWGPDKYCQCLESVSYANHTYKDLGTELASLTPSCVPPQHCPRLTKAGITALVLKKKALGIP